MRRPVMQLILVLLAVNSIVLGGYTYITDAQKPPHAYFVLKNYAPVSGCPGDSFKYSSKIYVSQSGVYTMMSGWISETDVSNISGYRIAHPTSGITTTAEWFSIPDLPSGEYLYARRMHFSNLTSDAYSISVTIPENC